ncbi:MAG: ATP-binding cassette domain-containing protein, partial [Bacteroidales bacterium]|nr:ATP-binding cassette domain-containing protein [Bacteroidales bacterium]
MLQAKNICKTFGHDGRSVEVLRGVNLSIARGEMIAVVGDSSSGKTTLLQILGPLDAPSSGQLIFQWDYLASMAENKLSHHP